MRSFEMVCTVLCFLALSSFIASAETKVYTNEDLKKYEKPVNSAESVKSYTSSVSVELNKKFPGKVEVLMPRSVPIRQEIRFYGDVKVTVKGCPTLQDALDDTASKNGSASVVISGAGRTEAQICDTVGRGCNSCSVIQVVSQRKYGLDKK